MYSYRFSSLHLTLLLLLLLTFPSANTYAADQNSLLWEKANKYYQQKNYDSAVTCYQQIAATSKINAELFYNIGNAYYRLNKIGPAILYYEKAMRLAPDNKLISDNLSLAKKRIDKPLSEAAPVFFERWWSGILHIFTTNGWSVLLLLIFCVTITLVYFRVRKKLSYSGRWISFSTILLLSIGVITFFSYQNNTNSGRAVVMDTNTSLLETPKPGAKISTQVPEGTTVKLMSSSENYVHVELPNGRSGWISSSSIEKI